MRRKSPMSNSHPPFISEGICRVQGCREEVILAKLRTTFIWQSWCPTTTHPARKTTKRGGEILCAVVSWFSSCQPAWSLVITENLNMLSWLPTGLTLGDLICDLWLKRMDQELMCLRTQWHGQISPRARLPTMQYPSTGEAMRRKPELHASEGVDGNASAFRAINDYSHVTSIIRAGRDRKWSGLAGEAARSPLSLVPPFLSHHFGKEVP